jgi:hypothetical protein
MLLRIAVILGSLLLFLGSGAIAARHAPSQSFTRACEEGLKPGVVSVEGVPMTPRIDTSRSYRELTRMASKEEAVFVLGLTRPVLQVETEWGFNGLEDPDSSLVCMRPSLRMRLRYDPVTVFIGREFVGDSCSYQFILAHEKRHVAVHVGQLDKTVATLRDQLQRRLGGEIHYGPRRELEQRLKSEIQNYWIPRAELELRDVRRQHEAIDTPEEYARAGSVCSARIARMLRRREGP